MLRIGTASDLREAELTLKWNGVPDTCRVQVGLHSRMAQDGCCHLRLSPCGCGSLPRYRMGNAGYRHFSCAQRKAPENSLIFKGLFGGAGGI